MASDPFAELGLPRRFDLTPESVRGAYLRRAASVHPDLSDDALGAGDGDAASAALNAALRILEHAESRAVALLALMGGPGPEDRSLPPGFLMEIMETREQVEAAVGSGDPARIGAWKAWALERRGEHMAAVAALFAEAESADASGRAAVLSRVRTRLNAWRYIERLIEQLEPGYDPARSDFGA